MRLKHILHTVLAASLLSSALLLASCGSQTAVEEAADMTDSGVSAVETTAAQAAVPDEEVFLNYVVSPADAGYVSGIASDGTNPYFTIRLETPVN